MNILLMQNCAINIDEITLIKKDYGDYGGFLITIAVKTRDHITLRYNTEEARNIDYNLITDELEKKTKHIEQMESAINRIEKDIERMKDEQKASNYDQSILLKRVLDKLEALKE